MRNKWIKLMKWLSGIPNYLVYINGKIIYIESISYLNPNTERPDNCFGGAYLILLMNDDLSEKDLWMEGEKDDIIIQSKQFYYLTNKCKFYTAFKKINNS